MRRHTSTWILVGAVVVFAGCGSDSATTTGASTTAAATPTTATSTTVEPTTSPATTATTAAPSTTAAPTTTDTEPPSTPPGVPFDPPCTEREPSRPVPAADEAMLDVFGRLGSSPSFEIRLPAASSQVQPDVQVARIPGGMLFDFASDSSGIGAGMLTAVDHDGTVRWQRCFPSGVWQVSVAAAALQPTTALVRTSLGANGVSPLQVLSLADGTITQAVADLDAPTGWSAADLASSGIVATGTRLVAVSPEAMTAPIEHLALIDLVDLSIVGVPPLPTTDPTAGFFEFDATGRLMQLGYTSPTSFLVPLAVLVDGRWSTDPATLRSARPITVGYAYSDPTAAMPYLEAYDGLGEIVWQRPDVPTIMTEGFNHVVVDDVVIEVGCVSNDDIGSCNRYVTGGYDLSTGATLWQHDGPTAVAASGHGLALAYLDDTSTWGLIDIHTGVPVSPAQSWDERWSFGTECCGGDVFQRTEQHGGIVVLVSDGKVRVFHPAAAAVPTVDVDVS